MNTKVQVDLLKASLLMDIYTNYFLFLHTQGYSFVVNCLSDTVKGASTVSAY